MGRRRGGGGAGAGARDGGDEGFARREALAKAAGAALGMQRDEARRFVAHVGLGGGEGAEPLRVTKAEARAHIAAACAGAERRHATAALDKLFAERAAAAAAPEGGAAQEQQAGAELEAQAAHGPLARDALQLFAADGRGAVALDARCDPAAAAALVQGLSIEGRRCVGGAGGASGADAAAEALGGRRAAAEAEARQLELARAVGAAASRYRADAASIGPVAEDAYDAVRTRWKVLCAQWECVRLRAAVVDREQRAIREEMARRRAQPRSGGASARAQEEWRAFTERAQAELADLKNRQQEAAQQIGQAVRYWENLAMQYAQAWQRAPSLPSDGVHQQRIAHFHREKDAVKLAHAVSDGEEPNASLRMHVDDMCAAGHLIRDRLREWLLMHAEEAQAAREARAAKARADAAEADAAMEAMEAGGDGDAADAGVAADASADGEGPGGAHEHPEETHAEEPAEAQRQTGEEDDRQRRRQLASEERRERRVAAAAAVIPEPLASELRASESSCGEAAAARAEADAELISLWREALEPGAARDLQAALVAAAQSARGAAALLDEGAGGDAGAGPPMPSLDGGLSDPAYALTSDATRAARHAADSVERLHAAHVGMQRLLGTLAVCSLREPLRDFRAAGAAAAAERLLEAEQRAAEEQQRKRERERERQAERVRRANEARHKVKLEAAAAQKQAEAEERERTHARAVAAAGRGTGSGAAGSSTSAGGRVANGSAIADANGDGAGTSTGHDGGAWSGSARAASGGTDADADSFMARELEAARRLEAVLASGGEVDAAALESALESAADGGAGWEDAGTSKRRGGGGAGKHSQRQRPSSGKGGRARDARARDARGANGARERERTNGGSGRANGSKTDGKAAHRHHQPQPEATSATGDASPVESASVPAGKPATAAAAPSAAPSAPPPVSDVQTPPPVQAIQFGSISLDMISGTADGPAGSGVATRAPAPAAPLPPAPVPTPAAEPSAPVAAWSKPTLSRQLAAMDARAHPTTLVPNPAVATAATEAAMPAGSAATSANSTRGRGSGGRGGGRARGAERARRGSSARQ